MGFFVKGIFWVQDKVWGVLCGRACHRSSEAITMNVYTTAFSENQLGYGSAKAIIMALIVIGITLLQVAITSRKEVQS